MHDGLFLKIAQTVLYARVARRDHAAQHEAIPFVPIEASYGPRTCERE